MTKREKYELIGKVFETVDVEGKDEILEFCATETAALDRKNQKARERAEEKKVESDTIVEEIFKMLTDEPITVNGILTALGREDMTPSKVVARANRLVNTGRAGKTNIKVDGRKLVAYTVA